MSDLPKPGMIVGDSGRRGERDAFHTPCILGFCVRELKPGDDVRFVDDGEVIKSAKDCRHGVVDPSRLRATCAAPARHRALR